MKVKTAFNNLKNINKNSLHASLAIVKEYKRDRISHYDIKYVTIDKKLENRLIKIVLGKIDATKTYQNYTLDSSEPEGDLVSALDYSETDFFKIMGTLLKLTPEEDSIDSINELYKAKSYLIILRDNAGIRIIGFKTLPENWKMKKDWGLIPLLFRENRFEDLEDEKVFSISDTIDFIFFNEIIFILSKKSFEYGLNFREGMLTKAEDFYTDLKSINYFENIDLLINKVGNNQRYLRKIATIKNLGYYKDSSYLCKVKELSKIKGWNIAFESDKMVFTEESLDDILTVLQNKRLHSELSEEDFDVESARKIQY